MAITHGGGVTMQHVGTIRFTRLDIRVRNSANLYENIHQQQVRINASEKLHAKQSQAEPAVVGS